MTRSATTTQTRSPRTIAAGSLAIAAAVRGRPGRQRPGRCAVHHGCGALSQCHTARVLRWRPRDAALARDLLQSEMRRHAMGLFQRIVVPTVEAPESE